MWASRSTVAADSALRCSAARRSAAGGVVRYRKGYARGP
jgi:hypothetical protein